MHFTSDLHLGHKKVLEDRGFHGNIDHHDDYIIDRLKSVNPNSPIWILGDIACGREDYALERLQDVKAPMHLVSGNHDSVFPHHVGAWKSQKKFLKIFESVQSHARIKIAGKRVELNHYPKEPAMSPLKEFRLHGHLHTYTHPDPKNINVGLDQWRMQLVSQNEIEFLLNTLDQPQSAG